MTDRDTTARLPATTKSKTPTSGLQLPAKIEALLLSGDSPVVGPNTADQLRAIMDLPEPPTATEDQVATMIGKLAMATAQAKVSDQEAEARLEMYWLALRDVPVDDLRAGFVDLIQTAKFLPTPAEVRTAAMRHGAIRRHCKSRARHLVWKHSMEWQPPREIVAPEELQALLTTVKVGEA